MPLGTWGTVFVTRDGSGWRAQARYRDFDGVVRPVERRGKTETGARNRLLEALRDRQGPTHGGDDLTGLTRFKDAAAHWIAEVRERVELGELSPNTLQLYEGQLPLHVLPTLGELRLQEITAGRLDALFGTLRSKLGASGVRTTRSIVSGVLGYAVRYHAIKVNPTRDARRIRGGPRRAPRALTAEERRRWDAQLRSDKKAAERDLPDLCEWLLATGVRIGEALAVTWDEVFIPPIPSPDALLPDWDAWDTYPLPYAVVNIDWKILRVTGEGLQRVPVVKSTDSHRTLVIPRFAVQMLWRRNPQNDATGPVFPDSRGGWRDPSNASRALREARGSSGFRWVTFHSFRKTCATILDDAGLTARVVADQLGHSKPSMTQDVYMGRHSVHPSAAAALDAAHRQQQAAGPAGDDVSVGIP